MRPGTRYLSQQRSCGLGTLIFGIFRVPLFVVPYCLSLFSAFDLQVTAASSVFEVVAALNQPQHPAAVKAAARVVQEHCASSHANAALKREVYTAAGAIPALVTACTTHIKHADVAENVCCAYMNVMFQNDAKQVCR